MMMIVMVMTMLVMMKMVVIVMKNLNHLLMMILSNFLNQYTKIIRMTRAKNEKLELKNDLLLAKYDSQKS